MKEIKVTYIDPQKYASAIERVIETVTESFKGAEDIMRVLEGCMALCIIALKEGTGQDMETILQAETLNIRSWLLDMESANQEE